jgi:hypothetical protein
MASKIHKVIWSILCGTTLGLGGCYDSDPTPPEDAQVDNPDDDTTDAADTAEEEVIVNLYGAPAYGPEL